MAPTTETVNNAAELDHAGQLARELLAVGYIREDSINRYKNAIRSIEAGRDLEDVATTLTQMRATGELREEGNDRYQAIMHSLGAIVAYQKGLVEDGHALIAAKVDQAARTAPPGTTRRPAAKRPAKKAKAKG